MTATTTTPKTWTEMGRDDALALALAGAATIAFATDAGASYARLVRRGETRSQIRADFEAAGEACVTLEILPQDA